MRDPPHSGMRAASKVILLQCVRQTLQIKVISIPSTYVQESNFNNVDVRRPGMVPLLVSTQCFPMSR